MQTGSHLKTRPVTADRSRRNARHRVRVFVRIFTLSGEMLEGISSDVSEGGMALFVSCQFEIGQRVRLEFRIPTLLEYVILDALVRNCNGFRCGVEFHNLHATHEIILKRSCERLTAVLAVPS